MKRRLLWLVAALLGTAAAVEPPATLPVTRVSFVSPQPWVALHSVALTRPCATDTVMGLRWHRIVAMAKTNNTLALAQARVWAADYDRMQPMK